MAKKNRNEIILVVDDAPDTLEVLHRSVEHMGFSVFSCESAAEAFEILKNNPVDLVITDYHMPFIGGLDLIVHVRENYKNTEVIMITGYASVEGAVEAIKAGAEEYLAKPFTDDELEEAIERSLEKLSIRADKKKILERNIADKMGLMVESEHMRKVSDLIQRAVQSDLPVLLTGEPGAGKELVGRTIHYESDRGNYPFIYINCRDIPEGNFENELFGPFQAEVGDYETADNETCMPRPLQSGFLELAGRGTVYLDEISNLSMAVQVKILQVLTSGELPNRSGTEKRPVSCRFISSTSKDLLDLASRGLFREDLFFRLNVINIAVPPMREREKDVLLLCRDHLARACRELGVIQAPVLTDEAQRALSIYEWPGNLRELSDLMNSLAAEINTGSIDLSHLPLSIRMAYYAENRVKKSLDEVAVEHMKEVLKSCKGNKTKAARILGIDRKTLRERLSDQDT